MRNDKLNKYKYYINKLGKKHLKEVFEDDETSISDKVFSDIESGRIKSAASNLYDIRKSDKGAYKEITDELISDYQNGIKKQEIRDFFLYYFTKQNDRIIQTLAGKASDLGRDFFEDAITFLLSGKQLSPQDRKEFGLEHISNFDLLQKYSDTGDIFDNLLQTAAGNAARERRKLDKQGLQTISGDETFGSDENSKSRFDMIGAEDEDTASFEDIATLIEVENNGDLLLTNPLTGEKDAIGRLDLKQDQIGDKKEHYDLSIDSNKVAELFPNLDEELLPALIENLKSYSTKAYIINNFQDQNEIVPNESIQIDFDAMNADEAALFYDAVKQIQNNALEFLKQKPYNADYKMKAETNFFEDFYIDNLEVSEMMDDVERAIDRYNLDQISFNKMSRYLLADYIQDNYGDFKAIKGKNWNDSPETKKEYIENDEYIGKWLAGIPTDTDKYKKYIESGGKQYEGIISNSEQAQALKAKIDAVWNMLGSGRKVPEIERSLDNETKVIYDILTGETEGMKLSNIFPQESPIYKFITDILMNWPVKGSSYNSLKLTNFGKKQSKDGKYLEAWISKNKNAINKLIGPSIWEKIKYLGNIKEAPMSDAAANDPEGAKAFEKAKALISFKMPDATKDGKSKETGYTVSDEDLYQKYFGANREAKYAAMDPSDVVDLYKKDVEQRKIDVKNKDLKKKKPTGLPLMREEKETLNEMRSLINKNKSFLLRARKGL